MGFLMGHSAWQIDQFPICWPMNGLFVHWSRGWGVSSFSERLVRYVPIIVSSWNFQELLPMTEVMSMQKVKVKGQRSRSQRSKLSHFRTLTPVSIHIWQQSYAQSLMWHRRGALFYFSRSSVNYQGHTWQKIADFDQNLGFPDWNPSLNWPMAMKWCTKLEVA